MKIHNPFGRLTKSEGEAKLQLWSKSFERPFNENVYHYTNAAALGAILSSRTMYCTDYRQLNDTTELCTGFEVVEALIAARGEEVGISIDDMDNALDHLALLRHAPLHMSMFTASFSFHGNDLTQWRAYAPSQGVSIGFRLASLERLAVEQNFVCGPVRYLGAPNFNEWLGAQLDGMKNGLVKSTINEKAVREQASNDPAEFVDLIIQAQRSGNLERSVAEIAGLLKNPDFRSEAEWRCVFVHRQNTHQPQKPVSFRSAGLKVVRFVELDLSQADLNELIAEVIVGPGSSGEETFATVSDLLRSAGVNAATILPQHAVR
ncbi:MAG: DUF2971 domain-containing protein [Hyphomicrobium sp.]|uniref:DUF2971 domain-containing protein n=1 Tax=Hyphomicrobium sp. TaxID=82 RepID=UPI0039E47879